MNIRTAFLLVAWVLSACAPRPDQRTLSAERYRADVVRLASPGYQGRGLATQGIDRAAEFIAATFRAEGLAPAFGDDYFQNFSATVGLKVLPASELTIGNTSIEPGKFALLGLSSPGAFTAPVVFAGYGISAPEYGYDDYAGVDVRGKTVLLLRYEPQEHDPASVFDGREWSEYATFRYKIFNAARHGAAAVLLVTGPKSAAGGDELVPTQSDPMAGNGFGMPMYHVARSVIEPRLAEQGIDLRAEQDAIDADFKPRSRLLDLTAAGSAVLRRTVLPVRNVGGVIRGEDDARTIVIGAHYDHLGFGGPYSVTGSTERVHYGADDNASGTAGLLELARWYARGPKPPVNLLFLAFSAEESGLVGSSYFAQTELAAWGRIDTMLNFDMIGRLRGSRLTLFGLGTAAEFPQWVSDVTPPGLSVLRKPAGIGPSDHTPFYVNGVPVLHFFTGSHKEYHTPADTPDLIHVEGALTVVAMARDLIDRAADADRLTYLPPDGKVLLAAGHDGLIRRRLGILADYATPEYGVRIGRIPPGSFAEGRLQTGDVVVGLGPSRVANYYELDYLLRRGGVKEPFVVRVLRKGEEREVTIE